ncbi:hypothetical protein TruAng_002990 [Truncatella angustata]|nr:hypothetical protein TruAng_002990 [Truncatella angustata]
MASTTVLYQMDKEQQQMSCWPENEELGGVVTTSENFFDDGFVTFDANDLLKDPQSPSAILDSLDDSLTNSSNDQDSFPVPSSTEDITGFSIQNSFPRPNESLPVFLGATDPVLGSISDSELLRLEGISLKSPNGDTTAPSSPFLLQQHPSPTKKSRFVDSVYATFRRATNISRPPRAMQLFKGEPDTIHNQPQNYDCTTNRLDLKHEPIDNNGLPLSPPLTSRIPQTGSYSNHVPFMTGDIEDPFSDKLLSLPTANGPSTPMNTPAMTDEFFFKVMPSLNLNTTQIQQPKQRNTSSAEWPVDGIINDDTSRHWTSVGTSYIPDNNTQHSPGWWDAPSTPSTTRVHPPLSNTVRNTSFSHNHAVHHQQPELPYEYSSDLSGLMIHMPQPRQPQAAVLAANVPEQLMTPTHHSCHPPHHRGHYTEHHHRRPQPRAPSSGARRHHDSMTSPRKSSLHHSSPRKILVHQEGSVSPSPQSHHRPRRTTSSSSISVRNQRSWSRAPRTPNPSSHSVSFGGGSPEGGGGGGGAATGDVGFVNYTPNDKNVLMMGVAPSGSSKTKARREKEAADRRRRLSEAAVKAVQAAGGDVDKLVREGFSF